jgi:hypothetical protein
MSGCRETIMPTTRRDFLRASATGALVLGLPLTGREFQEEGSKPPLVQARERMKELSAFGVAILLPESKDQCAKIGATLASMVHFASPFEVQTTLLEAVYVCVPSGAVETRAGETLVLLDPRGHRVHGARADLTSKATLLKSLRSLLDDDERRDQRVKAAESAALRRALSALAEDPTADSKSYQWLAAHFDHHAAPIAAEAAKETPRAKLLKTLVTNRFRERLKAVDDPGLPFGVEWKKQTREEASEGCPTCGMAFAPWLTREFLRFLTR